VKLVFVRNRNKKSEFLSILCTDTGLTEDQVIEFYGCRWGVILLFHTCKSFLRLQKSTQSLDYSEIQSFVLKAKHRDHHVPVFDALLAEPQ